MDSKENNLKDSDNIKGVYEFYADKKAIKKGLNTSVFCLFLPVLALMFFYLEGKLLNFFVYKNVISIAIFSLTIFAFIVYNFAEVKHFILYWERPIKLKGSHLSYLETNVYSTIDLKETDVIKISKKQKKPNLLEFQKHDGKCLHTIYLNGFSYSESNKLISKIKEANPKIIVTS